MPTAPVATRSRFRWMARLAFAAWVAAAAGVVAWRASPVGMHTGRVVLQVRSFNPAGAQDDLMHLQPEMLSRRTFHEAVVADPAIADLPTIRKKSDPVQFLEANLRVQPVERGAVEIGLSGEKTEDLVAILTAVAQRHIDEATSYDRQFRDEAMRKLESLAERLRSEISAKERAIALMIEANPFAADRELAKLDDNLRASQKDVEELDLRIARAKKKAAEADKTDLKDLEEQRTVAVELLAIRRKFRDEFAKGAKQAESDRSRIESLKSELMPQREALAIVERQRMALRIEKEFDTRVMMREPAYVVLNANRNSRLVSCGIVGGIAFVLALLASFALVRPRARAA